MDDSSLGKRWQVFSLLLNERQLRRWAGIEAYALGGRVGIATVERATGIARQTIKRGLEELESDLLADELEPSFLSPLEPRKKGGGRKSDDDNVIPALLAQMNQQVPGKVCRSSVLSWTCKSLRDLGGREVRLASHTKVSSLLEAWGYDIVSELWPCERRDQKVRETQYAVLAGAVTRALDAMQPVIVLSLSKASRKDPSHGRIEANEVARVARAERVLSTTIWGREKWDEKVEGETLAEEGWLVSAPDLHTVGLAGQVVRQWWDAEGRRLHSKCGEVLVVANALGLDGTLEKRWRADLFRFAVESGVGVRFCYLPTGICKWIHCVSRFGAVLAMQDKGPTVWRHKVVCRVIDWSSIPVGASPEMAKQKRELLQSQRRFRPEVPVPNVPVRFERPDDPPARLNWDYSISRV